MKNVVFGFIAGLGLALICMGCHFTVSVDAEDRERFDKGLKLLIESKATLEKIEEELHAINENADSLEKEINDINTKAINLERDLEQTHRNIKSLERATLKGILNLHARVDKK